MATKDTRFDRMISTLHILYAGQALCLLLTFQISVQLKVPVKLREIALAEAHQGVAVDARSIYAIDSRAVAKYDKQSGRLMKRWQASPAHPLIHLDSGVVHEAKLYCGHSNYPALPMSSSVEIWDCESLEHIGSHDLGSAWGSCTWIDRFDGCWWGVFGHYDRFAAQNGKDNRSSVLVQFNDDWQPLARWTFPDSLLTLFKPMSCSGGSWGPDRRLYVTGHDSAALYVLRPPASGTVLEWLATVPVDIQGQGIAWDRSEPGVLYGIKRRPRQAAVFLFPGWPADVR